MNRVRNSLRERTDRARQEEGFSLIELAVAVGILAILAILGVIGYRGLTDNSRKTSVEAAAAEVFTSALARDVDGNSKTDPLTADDEWMSSAGEGSQIHVEVKKDSGAIKVSAWYDNGDGTKQHFIERSSDSNSPVTTNPDDEIPIIPETPVIEGQLIEGTAHPLVRSFIVAKRDQIKSEWNIEFFYLIAKFENGVGTEEDQALMTEHYEAIEAAAQVTQDAENAMMANPDAKKDYEERSGKLDLEDYGLYELQDEMYAILAEGFDPETKTFNDPDSAQQLMNNFNGFYLNYFNDLIA